jgi:hypothetical protein
MRPELLDILMHKELPIENEQLLKYLTGQLPEPERHAVERQLAQNGFGQDALEGLQMMPQPEKLTKYAHEIKIMLRKNLKQQIHRKRREQLLSWPWLAIGGVLGLLFLWLVWWFFHLLLQG